MKRQLLIFGSLLLMLFLFAGGGAWAQGPYPNTGDQTVCITGIPEPYGVIPTTGSTYAWTVEGSVTSSNWTLHSNGANLTTITWLTPGSYRLQVIETITLTGCIGTQMLINVTVNPAPTATISGTLAACQNAADPVITFTGASGTAPYTFTYNINGGTALTVTSTGNTATVSVPSLTSGTFTYNLVSVRDASATNCSQAQTGSAVITIAPLPTAAISGTASVCQNAAEPVITFTGANGTAPYTFTYNINGGSSMTATSTGNIATVPVPTTATGTVTYNLVSVQDASATTCSQAQTGTSAITIAPLPTATVSGTASVCQNAAEPVITFTGANGVAPYTFTYNVNGGTSMTVTSTGNTAVVPVSTSATGVTTYNLLSVLDASATACLQAQAGAAVITIAPLPTASISGTASVCQNGTAPVITFTGANGTAPYTFTYNINGGASLIAVSTGNTVTVPVPTTATGAISYNLVSVQDASTTTCSQIQSGSAVISIIQLPTATIEGTMSVCQNAATPVITLTGFNGTAPYTFTYSINGGASVIAATTTGNSLTINAPTGATGTFSYALLNVLDANAATCSQAQTGTAVITIAPLPTAAISGTASVCQNGTEPVITFTGADGSAPYTFTYNINGGATQTIISTGNIARVPAPATNTGTYTYNLISVQDASGTTCSQVQAGTAVINVIPLPTATISGTLSVCQNAADPVITFTGANGTSPYTFTYNINGGSALTVTSTGNSATIAVPTTSTGAITYNLVSVQDAGTNTCSQVQTGAAVITVVPLPTATIGGTASACQNAAAPVVTFTGANGTAPYTFTYNINGGAAMTVTSTGDVATVSAPTATTGTFVYNLLSVQDASAITCIQTQTGVSTITVNPLPVPVITLTANPVCFGATGIVYTTEPGMTNYTWVVNGGLVTAGGTATDNTVTVTWNGSGPYSVTVNYTNASGCSAPVPTVQNVTVTPLPVTSPIYHN